MLDQIHSGDLGFFKRENFGFLFDRAEALLLMDDGPSDALETLLTQTLVDVRPDQRENAERFNDWVRSQARAGR
jgi:hypothetical protein